MSNSKLIAVQPRWWAEFQRQVERLASGSARVAKLTPSINHDQIDRAALDVLRNLLGGFTDDRSALTAELDAIDDGTSPHILSVGGAS
ncbi:MAG: hypothetical protein AAGG01_13880, partial [Planctomycetota bacterium]